MSRAATFSIPVGSSSSMPRVAATALTSRIAPSMRSRHSGCSAISPRVSWAAVEVRAKGASMISLAQSACSPSSTARAWMPVAATSSAISGRPARSSAMNGPFWR